MTSIIQCYHYYSNRVSILVKYKKLQTNASKAMSERTFERGQLGKYGLEEYGLEEKNELGKL